MSKFFYELLKSNSGQTIVEALVATAVVAIILVTLVSGLTYSVKNTAESKYRSLAGNLAQDAIEVFRRERLILGWATFLAETPSGTYCLNTLPSTTTAFVALTTGACTTTFVQSGMNFEREVVVTNTGTEVQLQSVVSWTDGSRTSSVTANQVYREWETTN